MIKYLELTAPEASAFRQVKILSIECNEGDQVLTGDTLFRVKSGEREIDLPSSMDGRVVEMIATVGENITLSTPLLLLETEVEGSTATPPIVAPESTSKVPADSATSKPEKKSDTPGKKKFKRKATSKKTKKAIKKHEQQMLNLSGDDDSDETEEYLESEEIILTKKVPEESTSTNKPETAATSDTMSASSTIEVTVPDIGTDSAKVIEILVKVGDTVSVEDPLVTLESDKASMDVPSTHDGVVSSISVLVDQDVSEGTILVELETEQSASADAAASTDEPEPTKAEQPAHKTEDAAPSSTESASKIEDVTIPDIGGDAAKVIEILVEVGQEVAVEDALVTLESDKASMDVPSSVAGVIESIEVNVDQDVTEGTVVVKVRGAEAHTNDEPVSKPSSEEPTEKPAPDSQTTAADKSPSAPAADQQAAPAAPAGKSHASPSIRRLARDLGVDLSKVTGSGRKQRVTEEDVKSFVKDVLTSGSSAGAPAVTGGSGIPPIPAQDFTKFGEIDIQPLNKIKRLTAENLHRSWVNVPHVTHNDESNISDLESFRKQLNEKYAKQKRDIKLSPLAFIVKAMVNAMQQYPQFNSSLEPGGQNLIYKKYFNIGIAVETPNGLVVPVVKDADKLSVAEIAVEMGELAKKARDKKLTMADMSGACITISSLGGIGGTNFTPIVNAPEVAILGVSRSKMQPVWNGSEFEPGMILPLSLSYDHRVIDGAEAARFTRHIAAVLEDVRLLAV